LPGSGSTGRSRRPTTTGHIPTSTSPTGQRCCTRSRTLPLAVFVELSAWPTWVNLTAAMAMLIAGEIGGFGVIFAGFTVGQLV
jgi:hypothetical protein